MAHMAHLKSLSRGMVLATKLEWYVMWLVCWERSGPYRIVGSLESRFTTHPF